jgi:tellurite resistance protein TerC
MESEAVPLLAWLFLAAFGIVMVVIDLFVAGEPGKQMTFRNSLTWSIVWFIAGIGFTIPVWIWLGSERGGEYLAGYLIERSLSLDNVFVFALIFAAFAVPTKVRQTALMWGILGAVVLRVIMIFLGVELIERFDWLLYVFGAFLVYTGIKMATASHDEVDLEHNRTLKLIQRVLPMTDDYHGTKLSVKLAGKRVFTPMVAVLAVIATTDLIFAFDSIPAIFAITTDPYVVVAANVLALAGLRSLYFLLEGMLGEFRYLQAGLAILLVIIGIKLIAAEWYHLPIWASLLLVVGIVGGSIVLSLVVKPSQPHGREELEEDHERFPELHDTEPAFIHERDDHPH